MTLLGARHRDPESAALSIAASRASKCGLLRESAAEADAIGKDYGDQLRGIADRNAERLEADVAEWLKRRAAGRRASEQTRSLLRQSIMRAYGVPDEWVPYALQYGAPEAIRRARESGGFTEAVR